MIDYYEEKKKADKARIDYMVGEITRETAKEIIMPYIDMVNKKAKELSLKYKQKYRAITFISFVR